MKKYKTTIIALLVLVVVVVGAVIVLVATGGSSEEEGGDGTVTTTSEKLFSITSDQVVKMEARYEGEYTLELVPEKDEDGNDTSVWKCTSDTAINANHNSVLSKIANICGVQGTLITDVNNVDEYGFTDGKSDLYCTLTTKDGEKHTVYIGNYDYTKNYRYVIVEGVKNTIYKCGVYTSAYLLVTKADLINMKIFTYLSTDTPVTFKVNYKGEKALELLCIGEDEDIGSLWSVQYPISRDGSNTKVNELVKAMKDISLSGIVKEAVPESELETYGLSPATIEYYLTVQSEDKSTVTLHKIKVGNKTEDGSYYYCIVDDGIDGCFDIYKVATSYIYYKIDALEYIDTYLYMKDSDILKSVDIVVNGEAHKLRYDRTTTKTKDADGNETEEEVVDRFFDGKEAPDNDDYSIVVSESRLTIPTAEDIAKNKDADLFNDVLTDNPYDCFNHLLGALYIDLVLSEIDLNEPTDEQKGEMLASVTYTENDGTSYKITIFKRDNTTGYAYINDKYAGGYIRTTKLFGDDYENYDFAKSLEALKIVMALVP